MGESARQDLLLLSSYRSVFHIYFICIRTFRLLLLLVLQLSSHNITHDFAQYDPETSENGWYSGPPQVMLAYLKYQWSLGEDIKRKEAFARLQVRFSPPVELLLTEFHMIYFNIYLPT